MEEKPKILIVDDDQKSLALLKLILEPQGYAVILAESGEAALTEITKSDFDLIILDVMMPGMNGFEVARKIRQDERLATLPIVIITCLTDKDDKVKAIEAGCDDFLSKPIDRTEVLARVKMLVKMNDYRKQLLQREFADVTANREIRLIELEKEVNKLLQELGREPKYK